MYPMPPCSCLSLICTPAVVTQAASADYHAAVAAAPANPCILMMRGKFKHHCGDLEVGHCDGLVPLAAGAVSSASS